MSIIENYEKFLTEKLQKEIKIEITGMLDQGCPAEVMYFTVKNAETLIASFAFNVMPSCCGILVSTRAHVSEGYRNRGIGKLLNQLRIEYAKYLGYSLLFCTDIAGNEPQQKILKDNGWEELTSFVNSTTKNTVKLHAIKL